MKTFQTAGLAAIVFQASALFAAPVQAGPNEFLPAIGCVGTTIAGELATSVWYQNGFAVNTHSSGDRDILCPIRYERMSPASTSVIVRAVVFDNTNDSGGKATIWICEAESGDGAGCFGSVSTTDDERGQRTLETSFTPNSNTRFLYLRVRLPDTDGDGKKSFLAGYRVCRGSC